MKIPNIPHNEIDRQAELDSYQIIGEVESDDYDFLTQMAAQICNTKLALISLVTEEKQWFLSHHGIDARETPRELSFCGHAINQPNEIFVVENALKDERFFDNPLVTGAPNVVFYAGMPLVSDNGFPLGTICVADDAPKQLTENQISSLKMLATQVIKLLSLRKTTFALKKQNLELKKVTTLFNESERINHIGAWEMDVSSGKTLWTDEVYNIHDVPKDYKHKQVESFYEEKDRYAILSAIKQTAITKEPFVIYSKLITPKNNLKWIRLSGKSWLENNKITKVIGTVQDITENKRTQEQLRISEEAFRGNFEHAAIGMTLMDINGKWLKVNKKICEILGYTCDEFLKLTFQDITHPDDLKNDLDLLKRLKKGERDSYTIEKRYFHKNGQIVYIIIAVSMVKDSEGKILYYITQAVDITALKTVEFKLANSLSYNQAVLNASTQVAFISCDLNGIITSFNNGAEQMLGYNANEIVGVKTPMVFHLKEEIEAYKSQIIKDKKTSDFDVIVNNAKKGIAATNEWSYKRKDGTLLTILLATTAIKQNEQITGYLCIATDISKMKKVENETKAVLDIAQSQNEKLKNFAYIVSHNLRSHSAGIASLIELIEMDSPEFSGTEFFDYLKKSSENLSETIKHLTQVVQINLSTPKELDILALKPIIDNNINSLIAQAKNSKIEIINKVNPDISIKGIPAYLDSIVMNFLTNAIKYSAPERESFVKIEAEKTKKYILLKFIDNGLGINLEKHGSKIFGMYKTFHNHKDSKGIGLFITKSQIEAMGGKIEIESHENVGTTFKIYLQYEKN